MPHPKARRRARRASISLVFPMFDEEENVGPLLALGARAWRRDSPATSRSSSSTTARATVRRPSSKRDNGVEPARAAAAPSDATSATARRCDRGCAPRAATSSSSPTPTSSSTCARSRTCSHTPSDFDIVAGYRAPRRDPWRRRVLALGWGVLVRALFGLRVRDIDCAFKVFRRPVLDALPIASIGAFVNTEVLLRARGSGFRIQRGSGDAPPARRGPREGGDAARRAARARRTRHAVPRAARRGAGPCLAAARSGRSRANLNGNDPDRDARRPARCSSRSGDVTECRYIWPSSARFRSRIRRDRRSSSPTRRARSRRRASA